MPTNYRKIFAIRRSKEHIILKMLPSLERGESGIYVFYRFDKEDGKKKCYIGQAKDLLQRLCDHLVGYQHIDLSIKNHGLYDENTNQNGWHIKIHHCAEPNLDEQEKFYIKYYQEFGWELYNITSGGQGKGKTDINERKESKKYKDGVAYGYQKAIKEVAEYFEKYLDFDIKPTLVKKDGTRTAISLKKYEEFAQLLKGDKENE